MPSTLYTAPEPRPDGSYFKAYVEANGLVALQLPLGQSHIQSKSQFYVPNADGVAYVAPFEAEELALRDGVTLLHVVHDVETSAPAVNAPTG